MNTHSKYAQKNHKICLFAKKNHQNIQNKMYFTFNIHH
jgi:hypothetical protein